MFGHTELVSSGAARIIRRSPQRITKDNHYTYKYIIYIIFLYVGFCLIYIFSIARS